MEKLATKYLGLELKSPVIVASSGLSRKIDFLKTAENNGAGAVVIKSLFEEQIAFETQKTIDAGGDYPEAADYIKNYSRSNSLGNYLDHIKLCKKELNIPVIASINCTTDAEWASFAGEIEKAGADALELNMNVFSFRTDVSTTQIEETYYKIIEHVKDNTKLNVAAKINRNFTNLPYFIKQLKNRGVNSFVLFNKYFDPIINTDTLELVSSAPFSESKDIKNSIRWIAVIKGLLNDIDISASTGVYDYDGVAQAILAGASSVQLCSVLYKNGMSEIATILTELEDWMDNNNFKSIEDFKSKLCYKNIQNPNSYERFQFIKHISSIE